MSDNLKVQLISAGNTFLATFLGVVGTTLATGSIEWTTAFWASIAIAAIRAAVKAVTEQFISRSLGGKK